MDNGTTRRGRLFIARPSAGTGRTGNASGTGYAAQGRLSAERAEECKERQDTILPEDAILPELEFCPIHDSGNTGCAIQQATEETIPEYADSALDSIPITGPAFREPGTFEPEDGPDSAVSAPYRREGDGFDYSHGTSRSLLSRLRSGRCAEWLSSGKVALIGAIAAYILVKYVLLDCIS